MPGQPQLPGWLVFDVTNLEITAEPGPEPKTIVKSDQPFDLTATFQGSGIIWLWLENFPFDVEYEACFYAEGVGAGAIERDLGCVSGKLTPGGSPYTDTITVPAGTLTAGLYIMGCIVRFPPAPGMNGFNKDLSIEVYD